MSWEDPFFPGELECTSDEGVYDTYEMSDFTHCNSAATGSDDNYLVSSRATSTVLSIAKDGSGVQVSAIYFRPNIVFLLVIAPGEQDVCDMNGWTNDVVKCDLNGRNLTKL